MLAKGQSPAVDTCDVFHLDPAKVSALKTRLLSEGSVSALAETFRVLGDLTRVRILDALSRSELCVCDIARLLGLSESAVSHQLRLLRGMRLVRPRREGRMMFYTLDDQHIVRLFEQGLEHVEERAPARPRQPASALPQAQSGSEPNLEAASSLGRGVVSRRSTEELRHEK
jgi:ArsR family transcriptional regulator, lead/cadmium/zinc/bismuth-responsive transcriptional repressor